MEPYNRYKFLSYLQKHVKTLIKYLFILSIYWGIFILYASLLPMKLDLDSVLYSLIGAIFALIGTYSKFK